MRWMAWSVVSLAGLVAAVGCSAAGDQSVGAGGGDISMKLPENLTEQAVTLPRGPDCLDPSTPVRFALAKRHVHGTGPTAYSAPLPYPGVTGNALTYEQMFWSIPRANGYLYLVHIVNPPGDQRVVHPYYTFLAGIRDRNASPPYLTTPPADSASVRLPQKPAPFTITDADWQQEQNQATAYRTTSPVNAMEPLAFCVYVYTEDTDANGNRTLLDFFALADSHDPNGIPW